MAVDGQGHPPLSGVRPGPAAAAPPATAAASPARLAATGGLVMSQGPASPGSIGRRCIWSSPETRGDWALLPRTSSRRGGSPHTLLPWATAVEAARPSARLSAAPERRRRMLTKTTLHATIPISRTVSVVQQLSATAFYPHGFATMDKTLFVRCLWLVAAVQSCSPSLLLRLRVAAEHESASPERRRDRPLPSWRLVTDSSGAIDLTQSV